MCGICAISRNPVKSSIPDARKFMRLGAIAIESRGGHATGFAWADPTGLPWYWKTQGPATKVAKFAPLETGMQVVIGHTRHATQGRVEDNVNNHPIIGEGLALVHNGRVENDSTLFDLMPDYERTGEVDSEAILAILASTEHFGASHPVEVLEMVKGVAAISWIDVETPGALHLARLSTRPLTVGYTRRNDLVMSSTPETMRAWSLMAKVEIQNIRPIAEGTYLMVVDGKIEDQRKFKVRSPQRFVPDDRPGGLIRHTLPTGKWSGHPAQKRTPNQNQKVRALSVVSRMTDAEIREAQPDPYSPEWYDDQAFIDPVDDDLMFDEVMDYETWVARQGWSK